MRDALTTVVPSIVAYGIVWGGLARQAGLSLGELVAMCLLVTAGTAQFVALPMLQAGAPAWLLVVTTYIVNLRHYLMAASLAPYFAHLSRGRLALLAHGVTDESYALTMARFARRPPHPAYFAGSAASTYVLAWYTGAASGGVLGGRIPDPHRYGLDFVFPAVFIAILARTIQAPWQWAVAGRGGAGGARSSRAPIGGTWHIALAGLGAAALGVWLAPRQPSGRRSRGGDGASEPPAEPTDEARAPPHVRGHGRGHLPDARAAALPAGAAAPAGLARAVLRRAPDRADHGARAAAGPARAGERDARRGSPTSRRPWPSRSSPAARDISWWPSRAAWSWSPCCARC